MSPDTAETAQERLEGRDKELKVFVRHPKS